MKTTNKNILEKIDIHSMHQLNTEYHKKTWNEFKLIHILNLRFLILFEGDLSSLLLLMKSELNDNDLADLIDSTLIKFSDDELSVFRESVLDLKQWCNIIIDREKIGNKQCPKLIIFTYLLIELLNNIMLHSEDVY